MATTKIWAIRGRLDTVLRYATNKKKTMCYTEQDLEQLRDVMDYVIEEEKTERQLYVTGLHCDPWDARSRMIETKKFYGKEGGIIAYHAYQSFAETHENVSAELAHQIGIQTAQELWGERFQVVVATHLNTAHPHNHFVLNSVSFLDGKRYYDNKTTYRHFREVSDRICQEHGLHVISQEKKKYVSHSYPAYAARRDGYSLYDMVRSDLEEALSQSTSRISLQKRLEAKGYRCSFQDHHRYWSITPGQGRRPIRTYRLGEEYTREGIEKKIEINQRQGIVHQVEREPEVREIQTTNLAIFYRQYTKRLCQYSIWHRRIRPELQEELMKLERYSEEADLLAREKIETTAALKIYRDKQEKQMQKQCEKREEIRRALRRTGADISFLRKERDRMTKEIHRLRQELRLLDDIEIRSPKLLAQEKEEKRKNERWI